ncbi:MAG: M20 family metallopeptidase [Verrucomicrobiales bacterium]|nr:M20 family metallopeptidase [Verrucomicrobiales bacterium]
MTPTPPAEITSPAQLLAALVRIPSVNPDGDPGSPHAGEAACARYVGDFLASQCGATVTYEEVLPGRPNVIGHLTPDPGDRRPRILFAPHTDTVSVTGMTIDPFGGEIRDGRVWGRGASDTKGTMAAMLWAFHELRDRWGEINATVSFAGFMGEETAQPGSRHFARHHRGEFDFAIVGEPTGLDVVYTHKGCVWVDLSVAGRACHGASPERGVNAITRLLPVLQAIDTELREELARFTDPVLGPATVNIGLIHGGSRTNIVPDHCAASLDFRETPALSAAGGAVGRLGALLHRHGWAETVAVKATVDTRPLDTDLQHPCVQKLLSLGARPVGAPWFCDAAWLSDLGGIPSVACGPGSIDQAHTEDEWLAIADLEAGADFYRRFLESL